MSQTVMGFLIKGFKRVHVKRRCSTTQTWRRKMQSCVLSWRRWRPRARRPRPLFAGNLPSVPSRPRLLSHSRHGAYDNLDTEVHHAVGSYNTHSTLVFVMPMQVHTPDHLRFIGFQDISCWNVCA